MKGNGYKVMII